MKKSLGFSFFLLSAPVLVAQTTVTAILPASGVTTGGDFVHIRVVRPFERTPTCPEPSCTTSVKFGDAFGRVVSNAYPGDIVAIAPPHTAGSVDVTVSTTGLASPIVLTNAYRYQSRSVDEVDRLLLPVAASGPGPNAARFETEILITNAGDEAVPVGGAATDYGSLQSPPPIPRVPPHTTGTFTDRLVQAGTPGAFIYVPSRMARDVITEVRVHDTSRESAAFGVEIPVVSDLDFAATVRLAGIPTDARFRSTLRVYAYNPRNFGPVTLRVRDSADGALLSTVPLALNAPPMGAEDLNFPPAAQLSLDSIIAPLRSHARLRIDIADSDSIRPIWGFVSITNNQTQEITLVTPQPSAVTPEKIPLGWWTTSGGNLISVGAAVSNVYLGCLFGTFNTPPSLDSDGRFKTTGSLSGPGPVQIGQPPLNFEGRVADGWLNLTIRSDSGVVTTGQFQFAGPQQPGPLPVPCL
jgi:hypothetical protein